MTAWEPGSSRGNSGCSSPAALTSRCRGRRLRCEVVGTALAEGFQIGELPAQCRQLSGVLALHQRPVRFGAYQPAHETVCARCGQAWKFAPHPGASVEQCVQEQSTSVMPTKGLVFRRRCPCRCRTALRGRPVVAGQIDHEALDHAVADVARFVELPHVEQVAGAAVDPARPPLAGVQLVRCQNRQLELDAEQIAGLGAQRPPLDGQHRCRGTRR